MLPVAPATLSQRWKALLAEGGWTQAQLARLLPVSGTAISNWVHVRNQPNRTQLDRLAELLGITVPALAERLYGSEPTELTGLTGPPEPTAEPSAAPLPGDPQLRLACLRLAVAVACATAAVPDADAILVTAHRFAAWIVNA